ncbi:MAG TPA: PRC-barrel domain-containing protein [Steroidobacteraceae bacterium]|nr:PRC-barrel domain-containing protein [Steroidobacteraceae bacterium]
MLESLNKLRDLHVHATDGDIGEVTDSYFDDERWVVRYLVVSTGGWLSGRKVLVSPYAISGVDAQRRAVVTALTRRQVQDSPSIDTAQPISRQQETGYLRYYGYPVYWPYATMWAWGAMPVVTPPDPGLREELLAAERPESDTGSATDVHLRSVREVVGYHIHASDDAIGHVEDFLFDDSSWAIRYVVVDTRNWLPGKQVLLSPHWIREVSWAERLVRVELTRSGVETSPVFDAAHPPSRHYEEQLHRHYRRPGYWH